ncbi:MAG: hypothetical protein IPP94_14165 [Ignavibacteria bacterium]|nr:hypothetical protein [Ignavibacteria bacterium]
MPRSRAASARSEPRIAATTTKVTAVAETLREVQHEVLPARDAKMVVGQRDVHAAVSPIDGTAASFPACTRRPR